MSFSDRLSSIGFNIQNNQKGKYLVKVVKDEWNLQSCNFQTSDIVYILPDTYYIISDTSIHSNLSDCIDGNRFDKDIFDCTDVSKSTSSSKDPEKPICITTFFIQDEFELVIWILSIKGPKYKHDVDRPSTDSYTVVEDGVVYSVINDRYYYNLPNPLDYNGYIESLKTKDSI